MQDIWEGSAAWVQAVGTIAAVIGSGWVAAGESRAARRREDEARLDAIAREQRGLAASKTAAQNLAILAARQIHELNLLLKDESRRGRIARVSPSRTVATTERLLTSFPIQALADADAMIAFSFFPGALVTASEIYANLEAAVRASVRPEHDGVFAEYADQMGRLDRAAQRRLSELKRALGPDAPATAADATRRKPEVPN